MIYRKKSGARTLSGTSKIIGGDNYELRITGLNDGAKWMLDQDVIPENKGATTVDVLPQTENRWLQEVIKSEENENVNWQLKFKKK